MAGRLVVAKIGTSSLTDERGVIVDGAIEKLCAEVALLRSAGDRVVVVTSGAIAAGLPVLGLGDSRPTDPAVLQAVSAVGQAHLVDRYNRALAAHGLVAGQVLLAPLDFVNRKQYLHARQTLRVLLDLGVVPVVNENDAIADDEIRFGDNDRLAALVSHLLAADLLVLLTDQPGLLTGDPRLDREASLIEEIVAVDHTLEALAGGAGSARGSGGMASKLAAAKMAAWSGVRAVIAAASRPAVLADAVAGAPGVGTVFVPRAVRLPARKLWIAFAVGASGTVMVDDGARSALTERGVSLLPAGVLSVTGDFDAEDAVELAGPDGKIFAKGLSRHPAAVVRRLAGRRSDQLPPDTAVEVVHRDDLVILP
ncbi:MAG TPA: glutamate 5-kinase [Acidimicrobiales bacterium]|nr:glutamate 5-kinase [Acidimicrobiales bacterium]